MTNDNDLLSKAISDRDSFRRAFEDSNKKVTQLSAQVEFWKAEAMKMTEGNKIAGQTFEKLIDAILKGACDIVREETLNGTTTKIVGRIREELTPLRIQKS